jgi:hypothetical protein
VDALAPEHVFHALGERFRVPALDRRDGGLHLIGARGVGGFGFRGFVKSRLSATNKIFLTGVPLAIRA